jgi:flavin-dependent dehydrogenase
MVEAVSEGWWYSAPVDGGVMVTFFADAEVVRRDGLHRARGFQARLRASRLTKERVGQPRAEPAVWSAASQRLNSVCGADWLAVGDAACTFDPLSSAGVVKALRSGLLGSFAALDWLHGKLASLERYARLVEVEFDEYLKTRAAYYGLERRWPQSKFWAARHSANVAMPRRESPQESDCKMGTRIAQTFPVV